MKSKNDAYGRKTFNENYSISKLRFINIYDTFGIDKDINVTKEQYNKFREEFYETVAEPLDTPEFTEELLDCIQAGINLYHAINKNNLYLYNNHIIKMNKRYRSDYWQKKGFDNG